jgi:hypothetical protein
MIKAFTDSAFNVLKPGGRFIGINTSPFLTTRADFEATHKYSIKYTTDKDICEEGDPLHIQIIGDGWEAKFDNYFWKADTYQRAFELSGFTNFRWVPLEVPENEHWQQWKDKTPLICFEAFKPINQG